MSSLPAPFLQPDALFVPVADPNPERLNAHPDFRVLKEASDNARRIERSIEAAPTDQHDSLRSEAGDEWGKLIDNAPDFLRATAKHMRVAVWTTEALVRNYGFEGLAAGFNLLAGLVRERWDQIVPLPDDEDLAGYEGDAREQEISDFKLKWMASLFAVSNGENMLSMPIKRVPLAQRDSGTAAYWEVAAGTLNEADMQALVTATDKDYVAALHAEVGDALEALSGLQEAVANCPGRGFSIEETELLLRRIKELVESARPDLASPGGEPSLDGEPSSPSAPGPAAVAGGPAPVAVAAGASRSDILAQILTAAEALEKLEPAGFTAPALREVVRKARLSPVNLVAELIPDDATRQDFLLRAGLALPKDDAETPSDEANW
ncbi:MAG: type VI secretion system ImpA family N-terminal domain-containing protein [Pseudomonadota bacterium]